MALPDWKPARRPAFRTPGGMAVTRRAPAPGLRGALTLAAACVALVMLGPIACSKAGVESLDAFEQRWHDAINASSPKGLYDLLDSQSRRQIARNLEVLRGLPEDQQRTVIDQLGGVRVDTLMEIRPDAYFARLWAIATDSRKPTMRVIAEGQGSAYIELELDADRTERLRLVIEGGRWAWRLPPQLLEPGSGSLKAAVSSG